MTQFKIKQPLTLDLHQDIKAENFGNDAESHTINYSSLDPKAKPTRTFSVPLNEYEATMLQEIATRYDRSQRYMARKLLLRGLKEELNIG